jgi:glyoxylase-like metal-dependent hydrolase (beta-lactamase superfamily II)
MQNTEHPIVIDDTWFTVSKLDESTFAISEFGHWEKVHSYLLIGDERAALIDTGLGIDHMRRMTDQLTDLPIMVLTTHVHADHIGSHGQYEEIYVHEAEEDWLVSGIKKLSIEQFVRIYRAILPSLCQLLLIPQRIHRIKGSQLACSGTGMRSNLVRGD